MFCFLSASLQVASISWVDFTSLLILVAIILSMVSLLLIFRIHLALISRVVLFLFCIMFSHLNTHIRWLAFETRICSSLICPFISINLVFYLSLA